ncbi:MAG TPA: MFS transporter [Streptosporangiaceae bacterium]|nr:MFS transporter [Streptosporangiaceae bacterium]
MLIEALDELVDGTKGAAFPLIRADLHLSYTQVGLLIAVPLLVGGLIELPLGILAGYGARRNQLVLAGGVIFGGSLIVVAFAWSFWVLLAGLIAFFPASGAFVSLTQAALMDADPPVEPPRQASPPGVDQPGVDQPEVDQPGVDQPGVDQSAGARERREAVQQQRMAAWNLAGSTGAVAGPILLAVVLTAGGSWRWAYLLLAGVTGLAVAIAAVGGPARVASSPPSTEPSRGHDRGPVDEEAQDEDEDEDEDDDERATLREALAAVRDGNVARWLILLEVTDLLLDVLTGYVGIYLVDVVHASPADAALGVAVRLGAGLAGDALFVVVSRRISGRVALTISATAAAVLYPAFLLVPWFGAKLAVLAALSVVTACWYPVVQAGLYGSLPGRSGIAVSWSSAAGLVGAVGPLLVGVIAQRAGLTWALAGLVVVPVAVLMIAPNRAGRRSRSVMR